MVKEYHSAEKKQEFFTIIFIFIFMTQLHLARRLLV